MIKVNFSGVGRNNKAWTASCTTAISLEWLEKQVKLMGGDIEGELGFMTVHGKGTIYAGGQTVGKYEVVFESWRRDLVSTQGEQSRQL